ncbi:MAG: hypothetical protein JOZ19_09240 [Rubrobacter sp.]|nr:hypothetical protein [Rubrobacter sp.]
MVHTLVERDAVPPMTLVLRSLLGDIGSVLETTVIPERRRGLVGTGDQPELCKFMLISFLAGCSPCSLIHLDATPYPN